MTMRTNQDDLARGFRAWTKARRYPLAPRLPGGLSSLRRCPAYPKDWRIYAIAIAFWAGFAVRSWI